MKYLYILASLFVLTACATGGPKYSGSGITTDPILESNRKVTYMTTSINDVARATTFIRDEKGVELGKNISDSTLANNNNRTIHLFQLLYDIANNKETDKTQKATTEDIINIYKIASDGKINCDFSKCQKTADSSEYLDKDAMIAILKSEDKTEKINTLIKNYFKVQEDKPITSQYIHNLNEVNFSISTPESSDNKFNYTLTDGKINSIKFSDSDTPLNRDNNESATFGNKSAEIISLAKNLKTLSKSSQNYIGLSYADFGFINKNNTKYGIYFGDYEDKHITPSDKTRFTTTNTKTNKIVQVTNPTFSGKAAVLIKDGEKTAFQEGVATLAYNPIEKTSNLDIKHGDYFVKYFEKKGEQTDEKTITFKQVPVDSKFAKDENIQNTSSFLQYYSNDAKNISEAAGKIDYTQGDNYYKAAFGVIIDNIKD